MPVMDITWTRRRHIEGADPAATLRVSRASWEKLGARFRRVDDGQGEEPLLAIATVDTELGQIDIGVLVYDDSDLSFLLMALGRYPERALDSVLGALAAHGLGVAAGLVCDRREVPATDKSSSGKVVLQGVVKRDKRDVQRHTKRRSIPRTGPKSRSRSGKAKGTVRSWDGQLGIGYIEPDDGGPRIVVEREDITPDANGHRNLKVGARVAYDVLKDASRPRLKRNRSRPPTATDPAAAVHVREAE